jgi:hypothetical protein
MRHPTGIPDGFACVVAAWSDSSIAISCACVPNRSALPLGARRPGCVACSSGWTAWPSPIAVAVAATPTPDTRDGDLPGREQPPSKNRTPSCTGPPSRRIRTPAGSDFVARASANVHWQPNSHRGTASATEPTRGETVLHYAVVFLVIAVHRRRLAGRARSPLVAKAASPSPRTSRPVATLTTPATRARFQLPSDTGERSSA